MKRYSSFQICTAALLRLLIRSSSNLCSYCDFWWRSLGSIHNTTLLGLTHVHGRSLKYQLRNTTIKQLNQRITSDEDTIRSVCYLYITQLYRSFLIMHYYKFFNSSLIKSLLSFLTANLRAMWGTTLLYQYASILISHSRLKTVSSCHPARTSPSSIPRRNPAEAVTAPGSRDSPHGLASPPSRCLHEKAPLPPAFTACPAGSGRESSGQSRPHNPEPLRPAPAPAPAPSKGDVATACREAPLPARRAAPLGTPPSVPVTPDAVQQLHEGEGQIEAKEEEEVAGGLVRQDGPSREHARVTARSPGGSGRRRSRSPGDSSITPSLSAGARSRARPLRRPTPAPGALTWTIPTSSWTGWAGAACTHRP